MASPARPRSQTVTLPRAGRIHAAAGAGDDVASCRSCQDAIEAIYDTCKGRGATRVWTLDADLAAAFDKLDHSHLMSAIGSFPGREMIRAWLTAEVFEPGKGFAPTQPGHPAQGHT